MEKRQQLPITQIGGLNLEEKETRHDVDKKINKAMNLRNKTAAECKNISE